MFSLIPVNVADRAAKRGGRLWDIDTGHGLMIAEPQAVTNALIQVAGT
jgi:hypothetical protein